MKKPNKPNRKEYWAGHSIENDEERYIGGVKQYADKAEKYIEHLEKKVNGIKTSHDKALHKHIISNAKRTVCDIIYHKHCKLSSMQYKYCPLCGEKL